MASLYCKKFNKHLIGLSYSFRSFLCHYPTKFWVWDVQSISLKILKMLF